MIGAQVPLLPECVHDQLLFRVVGLGALGAGAGLDGAQRHQHGARLHRSGGRLGARVPAAGPQQAGLGPPLHRAGLPSLVSHMTESLTQ